MFFFLLSLAVVAVEMIWKARLEKLPPTALPRAFGGGRLLLRRFENRGLMLGWLRQRPWLPKLLASLCLLAAVGFTWRLLLDAASPACLRWGLALLYGGAAANLQDRLRHGYVLDYISFPRLRPAALRRLVFNLADFAIFGGGLLILIAILFSPGW